MSVVVFLLEISPLCVIIYLYLSWNQWKTSRTPRCSYNKSLFNSLAVQYCSGVLKKPYQPTLWAFSPAIHGVFWKYWPNKVDQGKIEYLQVSNSGLVGIIWPQPRVKIPQTDRSPIVLLLTSSQDVDNTVQPFISAAFENGFRPAVFLSQDCQRLPKLKQPSTDGQPHRYNSFDDQADFGEAVEYIKFRYSQAKIYLVGLSFGNAILFKFITGNVQRHNVNGVVSVSPIWNMETQGYISTTSSCSNNNNVNQSGRIGISRSFDSFFGSFPKNKRVSFKSDSESNTSAVMSNDVLGKFKKLKVPMLVVYSRDDPLYSPSLINRVGGMWKNSDLLMVIETFTGGHVGFMQFMKPQSWAAELAFQYFDAVSKFKDSTVKDNSY